MTAYTVVFGNVIPEVLEFVAKDFGRVPIDMEDIEDMVATEFSVGDNRYWVAGDHIDMNALSAMDLGVRHKTEEQLCRTPAEDDYMCCNPAHVQGDIECYCGLDDCYTCRIYTGLYRMTNCNIRWYYVRIVE
jgi:hypothetical protein